MSLDPGAALKGTFAVCKEIYNRIQGYTQNNEVCARIEQRLIILRKIATDLEQEFQNKELPESCIQVFDHFYSSIGICKKTCTDLNTTRSLKKIIFVDHYREELDTLDSELQRACDHLQIVLGQISIIQNERILDAVEEGTNSVKSAVFYSKQGVYLPNRKASGTRPHKIEKPTVYLETDNNAGDLMVVKWTDDKCQDSAIKYYVVRYDDERNLMEKATVEECMFSDNNVNEFHMKLGSPKITPGNVYTIQVHGVNGDGPGEWSESVSFRFKNGPPSKPKKPKAQILSPKQVKIIIKKLTKKEENGSCVTRCKIEYIGGDDDSWEYLETEIKRSEREDMKITIGELIPDSTYNFRIKMINNCGESAPSDSCEVITKQLVPGPPQNLRISSKRKDTSIKVRWEEPEKNPQAACRYKVQKRQIKRQFQWEDYDTVEKMSCKIIGLKTDTKYAFRVLSVNNRGESEDWSDEVETETRYGLFGRTVCTIGAFVGGTVGGPVMGAVGGGLMAGAAAGRVPDSTTGKNLARAGAGAGGAVAGGLFGLIGAPIMGGISAAMANKKLCGEMEDLSPQTSDDENEPGFMTELFKNSNRMASDLLEN